MMTHDIPVFTARGIPDLINALPTLFGFTPEDSVIAIATFGPRHRMGFRLRLDLPAFEHVEAAAEQIVSHLARQGAEGAILIAVTDRTDVARRLVPSIERRLGAIRPVVSVWADGARYWTTFDDGDPSGHPYETSDHHVAIVQAIAAGQEILPNRAALAAKLEPFVGERRRWLDQGAETVLEQIGATIAGHEDALVDVAMSDLAPALQAALARQPLSDDQALRLGAWVTSIPVRDALWTLITPENAGDMVGLWSHVARCAPPWISAPSLCLAGFASWLSGDGALALIAAERALAVDQHYTMAGLLMRLLEAGVPPSSWRPFDLAERAPAMPDP